MIILEGEILEIEIIRVAEINGMMITKSLNMYRLSITFCIIIPLYLIALFLNVGTLALALASPPFLNTYS